MPKLNSLEVVHQDTNKDSYETLHDIIVGLKGSQNQEVVDNGARALYESLLELYTNDKEAFAKRIETLKAEFGTSLAQVVEEVSAYANASEASARRINTVSAKIDSSNAMVRQEMTARATADEALASQITTLSATVGSKNRTYYQSTAPSSGMVSGDLWIDSDNNKLYRYNGTSWEDIQDDQIGVNTAAISDEQLARTNADSAIALDISAVTARLDTGDFATVKSQAEASVFKNRVYAQTSQPTGSTYVTGDLWVDTDADNKTYRFNGSSWVEADRTVVQTFSQPNQPTAVNLGDLWIDTDDNNRLFRWSGSSWVSVEDNRIGATATRVDTLEARLETGDYAEVKTSAEASALKLQTRANLVSEITNWTLNGGLTLSTTGNGLVALSTNSGTYTAESPFFTVVAGQTYTITGDTRKTGATGSVYFDIIFYDGSGNVLKYGTQNPITISHGFAVDDTNRNALAVADTAPTGATQAKARFVASGVDTSGVGFRQVKVERGGLPATPFSQETTVNYASAKWGVTVDANGNAAGIALMADSTGTSEFVIAANKFRVKKPDGTDGISWNGTNSRLDISGDVYANAFYGNVVGTGNINNNAVSATVSSTNNSSSGGNSAYQLTNTVTITNNSTSPMYITGTYQCQIYYSAIPALAGYRVLNGSGVEVVATTISSVPNEMPVVSFYDTVPANSSISYNGYFWGEAGKVTFNRGTLTVLGLKK